MRHIRRVKVGDYLCADDFNAVAERLEKFANLSVEWNCGLDLQSGPWGHILSTAIPSEIWAQLAGSTSPYSWQQVAADSAGAWTAYGSLSGTADAYELNGVSGLDGKVARIYYTEAGDWRFNYPRVGCGTGAMACVTVKDNCPGSLPYHGPHLAPGVSIALTLTSTGVSIGTCTTDSSGYCCISFPNPTPMTMTATGDCGTASTSFTGSCTGNALDLTVPGASITLEYSSDCLTPQTVHAGETYVNFSGNNVNDPGLSINSSGLVGECVPTFGNYTAEFVDTSGCWQSQTDTVTVSACTQTIPLTVSPSLYSYTSTVLGCNDLPVSGVAWSLSGTAGSASGTTGSDGKITATGLKAGCTFTLTASKSRFNSYTSPTITMGCADAIGANITLSAASGYQCWCGCPDPVNDPLTITDGQGTHTFSGLTTACITKSGVTVSCVGGPTGCGVTYTSTVGYIYEISCNPTTGNTTLTRFMPGCPEAGPVTNPVESYCSGGVIACPISSPTCLAAGQDSGLANIGANESVEMSPGGCPLTSMTFSFSFGFADTATVNF